MTCRDLPEAITQGETLDDALAQAADCLDEALHARMIDGEPVPEPSKARRGERLVAPPVTIALKLSVYIAMREQKVSNSELARRLGLDEKEVRCVLDPHYGTKVLKLEAALRTLALSARVEVRAA